MRPETFFSFGIQKHALLQIMNNRPEIIKQAFEMNRDNILNLLSYGAPIAGGVGGAARNYFKGESPVSGALMGLLLGAPVGMGIKAIQNSTAGSDGLDPILGDAERVRKFLDLSKSLHESPDMHLSQGASKINLLGPRVLDAQKLMALAKEKLQDPKLDAAKRSKYEYQIARAKRDIERLQPDFSSVADDIRAKMLGLEHTLKAPAGR